MQVGELRPGDRHHLDRRVELHGAGAERDHRPVERQVAIGEAAHVAGDLGLGAVEVEDRMGEIGAVAQAGLGQAVFAIRGTQTSCMSTPKARQTASIVSGTQVCSSRRDPDLRVLPNLRRFSPIRVTPNVQDGALQAGRPRP